MNKIDEVCKVIGSLEVSKNDIHIILDLIDMLNIITKKTKYESLFKEAVKMVEEKHNSQSNSKPLDLKSYYEN